MYARMQKKTQVYKTVFWNLGEGEGAMIWRIALKNV